METIKLTNGVEMPLLGYGVFLVPPQEAERCVSDAHGKNPAQVIIRWHMQMGFSVIPGASNPDYIKENIETFDFALSNHEMERIHQLNKEKRYFNMSYEDQVKWFSQYNPTD